jgi:hypothetical protein
MLSYISLFYGTYLTTFPAAGSYHIAPEGKPALELGNCVTTILFVWNAQDILDVIPHPKTPEFAHVAEFNCPPKIVE